MIDVGFLDKLLVGLNSDSLLFQSLSTDLESWNGRLLDVEGNVDRLLTDYRSHELNVLMKDVIGLKKKQENVTHRAAKVFGTSLKYSDVKEF